MKIVSYLATLPKKDQYTAESLQRSQDKSNTLRYFIQGVNAQDDEGIISDDLVYQPSDVAVILGTRTWKDLRSFAIKTEHCGRTTCQWRQDCDC